MKKILYGFGTILSGVTITLINDYIKGEDYLTTFKKQFILIFKYIVEFLKLEIPFWVILIVALVLIALIYYRDKLFSSKEDKLLKTIRGDHKKGIQIPYKNNSYFVVFFEPDFLDGKIQVYIKHIRFVDYKKKEYELINYGRTFEYESLKLELETYEVEKHLEAQLYRRYIG